MSSRTDVSIFGIAVGATLLWIGWSNLPQVLVGVLGIGTGLLLIATSIYANVSVSNTAGQPIEHAVSLLERSHAVAFAEQVNTEIAGSKTTVVFAPPPGFASPSPPAMSASVGATPSTSSPLPSAPQPADAVEQLRRLAELRNEGILTDEEFEAKKSELLTRM